jgi:hypothetical protein
MNATHTNVSNNGSSAHHPNPKEEVAKNLSFVISDRTLVDRRVSTVGTAPMKMPDVLTYLQRLKAAQDPRDFRQGLDSLRVHFDDQHMAGQVMERTGLNPKRFLFSATGASQMARMVLPSRFFSGLRQLALMDKQGEGLARDVWRKFATTKDKTRLVRTVLMRIEGQPRRVIRSCHSTGYAPYSNADFAGAIIDNAGVYSSLPVLDWQVTDSAMRLRFAGLDDALSVLMHWDAGQLDDEVIPMVECWNSEVGRRKVGLRGGLYKLDSGGAIPHWDERREFSWIHRGSPERIANSVQTAFKDLIVASQAVVSAYNESKGVDVDDVFAWLLSHMKKVRSSERLIKVTKAHLDKAITVGRAGKLVDAIDAISLAALEEKDIFQQYEVERLASSLLRQGLNKATPSNSGTPTITTIK